MYKRYNKRVINSHTSEEYVIQNEKLGVLFKKHLHIGSRMLPFRSTFGPLSSASDDLSPELLST
jgi:hypothetical protein